MPEESLNDEQRLALGPEVRLVEAGPGAGKTRTVVERMKRKSSPTSGVALISFTNAAADEAKRRTVGTEIGLPPNFIGTFDKFLHTFVVTPWHLRKFSTRPNYVDSWDDLGNGFEFVRHRSVHGVGLKLSSFIPTRDGKLIYPEETPGPIAHTPVSSSKQITRRPAWQARLLRKYKPSWKKVYTTATVPDYRLLKS